MILGALQAVEEQFLHVAADNGVQQEPHACVDELEKLQCLVQYAGVHCLQGAGSQEAVVLLDPGPGWDTGGSPRGALQGGLHGCRRP
eukprot:642118-Rhodomonas_salina.7